mgnify:CR=1 FL=1
MSDIVSVEELPLKYVDMILDVLVGNVAATVSATAALHSFSNDEIYEIVVKALPKMVETEHGPELARAALGAALVRLVRQKMEATKCAATCY